MSLNYLVPLLSGVRYQSYYVPLAKLVKSNNAAIIFSDLVQRFDYHLRQNELTTINDQEGWFYHTVEQMEDRLNLSRKEQDPAIKKLKDYGLIETTTYGLPARRYFKININKFAELMNDSKDVYSLSKRDELERPFYPIKASPKGRSIYKDKEPKEEPKEEITSPVASSLSSFFYVKHKESNPKFKQPNLEKWAEKFDLMIRIDKYTEDELLKAIEFMIEEDKIKTGSFSWLNACQSPKKFREHYPTIYKQMEDKKKIKIKQDPVAQKDNQSKDDLKWTIELIKKHKNIIDGKKNLTVKVQENRIDLKDDIAMDYKVYNFGEPRYRENVQNWLKNREIL